MNLFGTFYLLDVSSFSSSKSGKFYSSLVFKDDHGVHIFRCASSRDFSQDFLEPGMYQVSLTYVLYKDSGFFTLTGIEHIN